ncbi:MAG: hypothetical protein AAFR61_01690 [Bacteroidota bacterium]
MKSSRIRNYLIGLAFSLLSAFTSSCKGDQNPCPDISCLNGGEVVECSCQCPADYTGDNCEIYSPACPGVECPTGQRPNPQKDCQCE